MTISTTLVTKPPEPHRKLQDKVRYASHHVYTL